MTSSLDATSTDINLYVKLDSGFPGYSDTGYSDTPLTVTGLNSYHMGHGLFYIKIDVVIVTLCLYSLVRILEQQWDRLKIDPIGGLID